MSIDLPKLVARMIAADETPRASREQSDAWEAHREAEQIVDRQILTSAMESVSTEKQSPRKRALYFIIGKISLNLSDAEGTRFMISRLALEMDKYTLSTMLDRLSDLPKGPEADLTPIYALLTDPRWLVRHAAINALANSQSETVEDVLLAQLQNTSDPSDHIYIHATLNRVGSARSIPFLRAGLKSRKRDVKISAQLAIEEITKRASSPQNI